MTDGSDDTDRRAGEELGGRRKEGTFLVTQADADAAVLRDVDDAEVHTLGTNPDLATDEVLVGTLVAEPPLEVTWTVEAVEDRWRITTERSPESPTQQAHEIAGGQSEGEVTRTERAGRGEVHVLTVPAETTDDAVADVLADEATRVRAARLGVGRVEVRSAEGLVSVRYLP